MSDYTECMAKNVRRVLNYLIHPDGTLECREIMKDAVGLYTRLGYHLIAGYPPYDKLEGAVCFAKELK